MLTMQVRMEEEVLNNGLGGTTEEGWNNGLGGTTEQGWNNGLSGGDIAAVVLYFILVLGIGLYVSPIFSFASFNTIFQSL